MPPTQTQDSFIDEDEQSCPLCVEEFDLSDRNFRPCPCGYQICQFCFNNIKNNMNGLCPACRRPYDDKTIEWKVVTPEEVAQFKANIQKNAKKKAEQRQKEAQKREVESLNRKHLAGLRVIQKNLVYVVGLSPVAREDDLLQTLRGEKYFGQYGKIIKIVVSKAKAADAQNNMGVYVTFARKEDAARCITAVNGSVNGDRQLRAQLGTTKYCSAYLRGETCANKACMFLHEPGDNEDSYSRQDLSSINSVGSQTQRPLPATTSASSARPALSNQALVHQAPVAAASQAMARQASKESSEAGDASALPSSASWANREAQHQSRRGSVATSGAASSPAVLNAVAVEADSPEEQQETIENIEDQAMSSSPESPARPLTPRSNYTPLLLDLISSITSNEYPFATCLKIPDEEEALAAERFPPLFDEYGGVKRKLAREQQEVAPLSIEQDGQGGLPALEAAEEEEPESGSLQLGGEPEDNRDSSNQPHQGFHDQRRPSSQMPIQRGNTNDNFYTHGQSIPASMGGRTLTPLQQQQLLLLKSTQAQPSGFLDQFPPGISPLNRTQSALFQQQGHNRQASRYSFASDSMPSATSVKPAANSKLMAQQASMMPQQGSQFYASSMQGPPPGLKSTGTPVSSNTMFGQSHGGFGGMAGNSLFGPPKENNSFDTLQNIIPRNRGGIATGSSQVHDGKREYNFSSFLSYPSTSTPAPASGVLASLYGSQPGAFHDFGPKQKKKGKKHRHANTSSSGGSGLVDLADPSILQARMQHHQQQQTSGAGQGLYGGQVPGGYNPDDALLPLDDEAFISVDALVADSDAEVPVSRPFDAFDRISRSSTPVVPPGLYLPHAHPTPNPPLSLKEEPAAKAASRILPTSAPFTPSRATSSSYVPRAATPLTNVSVPPTPTDPRANIATMQAKKDVKSLAAGTGLSKEISAQGGLTLQPEDFPSLEPGKPNEPPTTKAVHSSKSILATPMVKNRPSTALTPLVTPSGPKSIVKRSTTAAVPTLSLTMQSIKEAGPVSAAVETPSKQPVPSDFPALPPSTPASASISSPAIRNAPKTLRVLPTPKGDSIPKAELSAPSSASSMHPPGFLPSRQPSLASISRLERSGTPVSEIISDNASITSASVSRASSPPPSRVGSAPVRATTKAQQKKQRREAQKKKEESELETVEDKDEKEVEVGPIMGRMKKQKKAKPVKSAAGTATPLVSRPPSPSPVESRKMGTQSEISSPLEVKAPSSVEEIIPSKNSETKGKNKQIDTTSQEYFTPEPVQEEAPPPPVKHQPTAMSVFQDLIGSGSLPADYMKLGILNNPVGLNHRHEFPADMQDLDQSKLIITDEDKLSLKQGHPVRKVVQGSARIMLTPNGDCVRNLTQEEEDKYIELQKRILGDAGPTAFSSSRHNAEKAFTLIGGRAVPNGPPPFFPVAADPNSPKVDPVGKIQRDEALNYINQYVLPSLSANSQLEKALNASALDVGVNNSTGGWDALGVRPKDETQSEQPYGGGAPSSADGILATDLENMTAHLDNGRGQHLGNVTLLNLSDSENAVYMAKRETEKLEKSLNQLLKKNRRLLLGAGH